MIEFFKFCLETEGKRPRVGSIGSDDEEDNDDVMSKAGSVNRARSNS